MNCRRSGHGTAPLGPFNQGTRAALEMTVARAQHWQGFHKASPVYAPRCRDDGIVSALVTAATETTRQLPGPLLALSHLKPRSPQAGAFHCVWSPRGLTLSCDGPGKKIEILAGAGA
jgi:hypothetical protein